MVDENATDLKQYGLEPGAHRGRLPVEGPEGPAAPPDRREDADRQRPLRPLPRSEAGVPRHVVPRHHVQQEHLRAARQAGPHLRSREGRWTRALQRHDEDAPDKERTRLAIVSPIAVRADFAAVEGALERLSSTQMQGIVDPDGTDPQEVRPRRSRPARSRSTPGARAQRSRSGQTENAVRLRQGRVATAGLHGRADAQGRRDQGPSPTSGARICSTAARLPRRKSNSSAAPKRSRSRRARARTIKDVWKAGGKDVDSAKADDLLSKVTALRAAHSRIRPTHRSSHPRLSSRSPSRRTSRRR